MNTQNRTSLFICIVLATGALSQAWAADITKGHTFTDGDTAFAGDFNDLLDLATINSTFFTGKSATTTPASGDTLLEYNASAADFRKVTLNNLLLANTALITGQTEDTSPATNDFLLSYDTSATGFKKVALATVRSMVVQSQLIVSNKPFGGTAYNFAHSLPARPQLIRVELICTNAAGSSGYALNDIVPIEALTLASGNNAWWTAVATASSFKLNVNGASAAMNIVNPAGTTGSLTAADWNLRATLYYFPP